MFLSHLFWIWHGWFKEKNLKKFFRSDFTLAACSRDGFVKLFKFSEEELGILLSKHEMVIKVLFIMKFFNRHVFQNVYMAFHLNYILQKNLFVKEA